MRILLLATSASGGGAMTATRRLFDALRSYGLDVRLLTLYQHEADDAVRGYYTGRLGQYKALGLKALERLDLIRHNAYRLNPLWRLSSASTGVDLSQDPWVRWADVIHINWINHGFLSLATLARLKAVGKPLVWTLHDLWAATGACHLPFVFAPRGLSLCPRYGERCGYCPLLSTDVEQDYSRNLLERKAMLHSPDAPIHYVAVSSRSAKLFDASPLRRGLAPCHTIPPPIELSPINAEGDAPCPEWYQPHKDYILLVANRLDDEVKGYKLLPEVLDALSARLKLLGQEHSVELVLVGEIRDISLFDRLTLPTHRLGRINAPQLRTLYRHVASLTLSLSLFETFGQTLTESLSYGKPVVAFRSYGPEDIIQSGINGYLATAYDTEEMAELILRTLQERRQGAITSEACRLSLRPFLAESVAKAYHKLYRSIL